MTRRKIIRQGSKEHSSLTITLPASWVQERGLKAGDEVDVEANGNIITVQTDAKRVKSQHTCIDVCGLSLKQTWQSIGQAYRLGFDSIEIKYRNIKRNHKRWNLTLTLKEEFQLIVVPNLMGMEIESIDDTRVIIRQFSEAIEDEFDTALHKIFFQLKESSDAAIAAVESMDSKKLQSMWMPDRALGKFCNFCLRILNKRGYRESSLVPRLYACIVQFELLGDMIYLTPQMLGLNKVSRVTAEVVFWLKEVRRSLNVLERYYYTQDEKAALELVNLRERATEWEKNCLRKDPVTIMVASRTVMTFELIVNLYDTAVKIKPQSTQN